MKIKGVFLAAILTAVLCISGNLLAYSGGTGEPNNPYKIADVNNFQQLSATSAHWNKSFILTANINLTGLTFTQAPIAPDTSTTGGFQGTRFTGIFDGNNHTISNLTITASTKYFIGLFGCVGSGGKIRNLGVEDVNMTGGSYVGGLVGGNGDVLYGGGTITSCYATGSVTGTEMYDYACVGGLVGLNYFGIITSCYSTGSVTVSGDGYVGGLVGFNYSGMLTACYATGSVTGTGNYYVGVGGLVGYNQYGTIDSCYATGSVSGYFHVGGLVGYNNSGSLTSCYAAGSISGTSGYVGGLVGANGDYWRSTSGGTITSCHATGSVSGRDDVGGLVGGNNSGTLTGCYATGSVNGTADGVGGLVGQNREASINACYATGAVSSVTGEYSYVGGLVGENDSGMLKSCYATGSVSGTDFVGGLVGVNGGTLTACYATGAVSGTEFVGGLVGDNDGSITGCYATGSVTGTGLSSHVGGLVGENYPLSTLTHCYATGSVSGADYVGGLVGKNWYGSLIGCYATGSVTGTGSYVGGLVGWNGGSISNCYAAGAVSGTDIVGGLVGGGDTLGITGCFWDIDTSRTTVGVGSGTSTGVTGKTTAEMMTLSTFTSAGWDFSATDGDPADWMMLREGEDYPRLIWQEIFPGDIAGLYGVDNVDLEELASHWMQSGCPTGCEGADIDDSGSVDFVDFAMLAEDWLKGTSPEPLVGDFTGDLKVDYADLYQLTLHWLSSCSAPGWCDGTDLDQSGSVDFEDFAMFAENWMDGI
jgi:hypothetical protein